MHIFVQNPWGSEQIYFFLLDFTFLNDICQKIKWTCKPGFVRPNMTVTVIYLGLPLPAASSELPESRYGKPHRAGPATGFLFVLASDGACNAVCVTTNAVVSYTAFSPLPINGGILSVALSRGSPRADVIRHPAL